MIQTNTTPTSQVGVVFIAKRFSCSITYEIGRASSAATHSGRASSAATHSGRASSAATHSGRASSAATAYGGHGGVAAKLALLTCNGRICDG